MRADDRRTLGFRRLLRDCRASVAIEYALIATLMAAALIGSLVAVSGNINRLLGIAGTGLDFPG